MTDKVTIRKVIRERGWTQGLLPLERICLGDAGLCVGMTLQFIDDIIGRRVDLWNDQAGRTLNEVLEMADQIQVAWDSR